jgi:antitoxin HigA-1
MRFLRDSCESVPGLFLVGERRCERCRDRRLPQILDPIHPGEILLAEFLEPLGLSQYRLAKGISVPPRWINEIVHGKRAVTADTALRLARFFGTSDRFWLNLQTRFDLEVEKDRLGHSLESQVEVLARAG